MTLTALATAAGMPSSKAHKYLASFIRAGLVAQPEAGGRYDLGPFALDLGLAAMRRIGVMEIAQSTLDDLRDGVGATVAMAVWANHGPTIVRIAEMPGIMSLTIRIGSVMPILTSSIGRCFATFLSHQTTRKLMQAEITNPSESAIRKGLTSPQQVEAMLAEFRSRGMSVADNPIDPGRAAICAPVFDLTERMVAALAIIGVRGSLDTSWDGKPACELLAASRSLSRRIGSRSER
jgi:DNA-binding IclR family transcriptional regulator